VGGGVQLGSLGSAATNMPIVLAPGDYVDGEIGGMIGKGNQSTWRKPALIPLCLPQTAHAAQTRTRAAVVGSQQLTALAMAWQRLLNISAACINTLSIP
jgi:phage tail tape-measure protein